MPSATIRLHGYRETMLALRNVDRGTRLAVTAGLREAAWPVQSDIKSRLRRYNDISLDTIGIAVRLSGVAVTQRKKKVTGERPDFGALQMRKGFIPALWDNAGETERAVGIAFDELVHLSGFH